MFVAGDCCRGESLGAIDTACAGSCGGVGGATDATGGNDFQGAGFGGVGLAATAGGKGFRKTASNHSSLAG